MPAGPYRCRWCEAPLSDLERRTGDRCGRSACHHRAAEQQRRDRRSAALEGRRAAHTAARSAAVVWLRHAACAPAPVSVDGRAEHAAHLQAVAAAPEAHRRRPELAFAEDRGPAPAADPLVCGLCRGRCCNAGRATQGFIDAELLERHAAEHGGTHDAAAAYLARVPPEHVAGSCLYHGAQGCVLPRTMRAPVCNGFARPPLEQARALDAAGAAMVLAAYDGAVLRGAAFVAGGLREAEALRRADS